MILCKDSVIFCFWNLACGYVVICCCFCFEFCGTTYRLNPRTDKTRQHYKQVLTSYPTKLRGAKGQVIAKFDKRKNQNADTKEFFHKGRDKFMNKLRWRDNPQLKERGLQKRAKKMKISLTELKRRLESKKLNPNSNVKIYPNNGESDDSDNEGNDSNKQNKNNKKTTTNAEKTKQELMQTLKNINRHVNKNKWGNNLNEKRENILKQQTTKRKEIKHQQYLKRQRIKRQIKEEMTLVNGQNGNKNRNKNKNKREMKNSYNEEDALNAMGDGFDVGALGKEYGFGDDSDPNDGNEYASD